LDFYRRIVHELGGVFGFIAGLLWGCRHRKTTRPITLPAEDAAGRKPGAMADTYVACLDCGRHLAYDWNPAFNSPNVSRKPPQGPIRAPASGTLERPNEKSKPGASPE
jgi:hypothetical protein